MNNNVLKITQGALMTAIFGALVFINRQTAGFLQEVLVYIYPLPLAIYAARYGVKTGLIAAAAMTGLSLFLGATPTYAFYAITSLLTGLALGGCLYHKASAGKTMFAVMLVSIVANLTDLLFAAFLSGITLENQAVEMQTMMQEALGQYKDLMFGTAATSENAAAIDQLTGMIEKVFTRDYIKRIIIISTVIFGIVQGFLIYELSLLIMRRLRIRVPKPVSLYEFRPPVWTAYAALALFCLYLFGYQLVMDNTELRNAFMTAGLCGYMYLVIFGIIGGSLLLKRFMPRSKVLPVLLALLAVLVLPYPVMIVGFLYVSGLSGLFPKTSPADTAQESAEKSAPKITAANFRPDYLILVNDYRPIPEGYDEAIKPFMTEYTEEVTGKTHFVEKRTLQAFLDLRDALREDGVTVAMAGCYRSVARQQEIADSYSEKYGADYVRRYVARPGYSEHHTGLALDLFLVKDGVPVKENAETMKETELWRRVHGRISGFGFILRYPEGKEKVTGIAYEPWHLRFVGEATAQRMAWHELTLEEYLEKNRK